MATTQTHEEWTTPAVGESRYFSNPVAITAAAFGQPVLLAWIDWQDGPHVTIGVSPTNNLDDLVTSESTENYPAIEKYWPRDTWPREVYAGQRTGEHDAEPALRAILDAEIADNADEEG